MLLWDFLSRVMQGVTMAFFEDVWSRNFLNLFATPLSISEYLGGLVLTGVTTSLLGLVAMVALATLAFGLSFFSYGVAIGPFFLILFLTGIALGIAGCAIVLRFGPASEWLIWPIPGILSPFAGVYYPIHTLPHWMQWIARCLPPSYVFEGMRAAVAGKGVDMVTSRWAPPLRSPTWPQPAPSSRRCIASRSAPASSPVTAPRPSADAPPHDCRVGPVANARAEQPGTPDNALDVWRFRHRGRLGRDRPRPD